jgi:hypothetical protein
MGLDLQAEREIDADIAKWARRAGGGVVLGTFAGFSDEGQFLVRLHDDQRPRIAVSTVRLADDDVDAEVVIAFEKMDQRYPIIIGRLQERPVTASSPSLKIDGERVLLRAEREIELRCGEASIVLTRAGKVLIRGDYVLTRSRGANKIKGAYVDIN